MPSAIEILADLRDISNQWRSLAALWHVYFAAVLGVSLTRVRRSTSRTVGVLLTIPLFSVSLLAWMTGNPFTGLVCGILAGLLIAISLRSRATPVSIARKGWAPVGGILCLFAWTYPHFLNAGSALQFLYESPLGLIPCPTLSMLVGTSIMFNGFQSRAWGVLLGLTGLFYGIFGALFLEVHIDWVLAAGAFGLLARVATKQSPGRFDARSNG